MLEWRCSHSGSEASRRKSPSAGFLLGCGTSIWLTSRCVHNNNKPLPISFRSFSMCFWFYVIFCTCLTPLSLSHLVVVALVYVYFGSFVIVWPCLFCGHIHLTNKTTSNTNFFFIEIHKFLLVFIFYPLYVFTFSLIFHLSLSNISFMFLLSV